MKLGFCDNKIRNEKNEISNLRKECLKTYATRKIKDYADSNPRSKKKVNPVLKLQKHGHRKIRCFQAIKSSSKPVDENNKN